MLDYMQLAVVFVLGFAFVCQMLNHTKKNPSECESKPLTPKQPPWPPGLPKMRQGCVSGNLVE